MLLNNYDSYHWLVLQDDGPDRNYSSEMKVLMMKSDEDDDDDTTTILLSIIINQSILLLLPTLNDDYRWVLLPQLLSNGCDTQNVDQLSIVVMMMLLLSMMIS